MLPTGGRGTQEPAWSGLTIEPANLLAVSIRPALTGKGIVLHLREVGGRDATLSLDELLPGKRLTQAARVNVLDEVVQPLSRTVSVEPLGVTMFKVEWQ